MIPYVLTANEDEEQVARGTADVGVLQVAQIYAGALLNATEKAGAVDQVLDELEELLQQAQKPRSELRRFFASGVIGRGTRADLLRKVFEGRVHPLLLNFFLVVNDHERMPILGAILFEAKELRQQRARQLPVYLHVAVQPTEDQIERIRRVVRERLNLEPLVEVKVDPEVLGGIMLRVGDWVFDNTVRSKLDELRKYVIARSSHEIQSGRDRFGTPA